MPEARRPWWSLRRPAGVFFWTAAFLLVAGFLVPLINANRFRRQIQTALEAALGRKVEIGEVTLRLLPAPGFHMQNVVVADDPAFGAEHFAYMTSMQVRLRLRTLWTGQVQLASLLLEEPSINLVKTAGGKWNFEALMERAGGGAGGYLPYIGIEDGRVNFKFGEHKSLFHFQAVEAAISPPRDTGGRWGLRFGGRPARTDQVLSGMGRLRGQGTLSLDPKPALNLEVTLEQSPMSYLLRLARGRDYGVHGTLGARLRLSGEPAAVRVSGTLQAGDVHRWDLMPGGENRVETALRGLWDVPSQRLTLETTGLRTLRAEFHLASYLSRPQWRGAMDLAGVSIGPVVQVAQHLGASLPPGLQANGTLDGRLEFDGSLEPRGTLRVSGGRISLPDRPDIEVGPAEIQVEGAGFSAPPAPLRIARVALEATASGRWSPFRLEATVIARAARLDSLKLVSLPGFSGGVWDGRLLYRSEPGERGGWSGAGTVKGARWQPEGLESPVELAHARVRWTSQGLHVEAFSGAIGNTPFAGVCRNAPAGSTCRVRLRELQLSALDRWLHPRRAGSRWAVWRRALGLDSREPGAWLRTASVQGSIQADRLEVGNWIFRKVRSEVEWRNGILTLSGLRAELGRGAVTGAVKVDLAGAIPRYSVQTTARGVDLRSLAESGALPDNFQRGLVDVRLGLSAAGRTAAELRTGVKVQGVFTGRGIALEDVETDPDDSEEGPVEIRSLEGQFEWGRAGLLLSKLRMALGKEVWEGQGSIGGDQPVTLEMAAGPRQWRLISSPVTKAAVEP
jgi:AsmA protein